MSDRAFQYDLNSSKWIECTDKKFIESDIENLPSALIFLGEENFSGKNFLFCPKHKQLEEIILTDGEEVITETFCNALGLFGVENYGKEIIPLRWRINLSTDNFFVNIAVDCAKIRYYARDFTQSFKSFSVSVSIKKHISSTNWIEFEIPEIIVEAAMEALRESTKAAFGFKPTVITKFQGSKKIFAYIERPFDPNIIFLKYFFRDFEDFNKIFPYDCTDNYKIICQLLEIKPPKSLRRAYAKNPYAIIWYMIFKQWGIRDINFMQKFFLLDECIGSMYLSKFHFCRNIKRVVRIEYAVKWRAFEYFCKAYLKIRGEKIFMNWLYQASMKGFNQNQVDTIDMFYNYEDKISDELKTKLFNEGLTWYIHDAMSMEIGDYLSRQDSVRIIYDKEIMTYESQINGYKFKVVRDTKDLYHIGLELENCVMTYRDKVVERKSIIVVVTFHEKYVACIEIENRNAVVQALGRHNELLQGELLFVFNIWTSLKNLEDYSEHEYQIKVIGEKTIPSEDLASWIGKIIFQNRGGEISHGQD